MPRSSRRPEGERSPTAGCGLEIEKRGNEFKRIALKIRAFGELNR